MMQSGQQTIWISVGVIVLVLARFLFRELRARRMKTGSLFAVPVIVAIIGAFVIYSVVAVAPDQIPNIVIGGMVAIVVGIGIGLAVAHFTTVRVSEPGTLLVRGSWVTVAIWVAALTLRLAARWFVSGGQTIVYTSASSTAGPSLMLNAVLIVMLTAALTTVRVRILAVARALPPDQTATAA
jgi:hypothetical protein